MLSYCDRPLRSVSAFSTLRAMFSLDKRVFAIGRKVFARKTCFRLCGRRFCFKKNIFALAVAFPLDKCVLAFVTDAYARQTCFLRYERCFHLKTRFRLKKKTSVAKAKTRLPSENVPLIGEIASTVRKCRRPQRRKRVYRTKTWLAKVETLISSEYVPRKMKTSP